MGNLNITVKSPCKINLGLKVLNQRDDGFHNISSIFIELNLFDSIEFKESSHPGIKFKGANIPRYNTVQKAVGLIKKYYNISFKHKIIITKNIPIGGGLGGGSSNGASTLKSLNTLYKLNIPDKKLLTLSKEIGSDVPFFIGGGIKKIMGTGDIIENINYTALKNKYFLLVVPSFSISTSWAYKKIKKHLDVPKINPKFPALTGKVNWALFENDFEQFVCSAYPEILDIKKIFCKSGALYSSLSGSGSTVFGIYNDMKSIEYARNCFDSYHTYLATPQT